MLPPDEHGPSADSRSGAWLPVYLPLYLPDKKQQQNGCHK
jgi:hypothetical protein